jgi:hypothetical protein
MNLNKGLCEPKQACVCPQGDETYSNQTECLTYMWQSTYDKHNPKHNCQPLITLPIQHVCLKACTSIFRNDCDNSPQG